MKNAISKNLEKLYKSEKGADVVFVLKSKLYDGEFKVCAHKAILAASSLVFDRMFYGDLKEGAEVKITDVSYEGFCEFLQFFYLAEIELTEENKWDVFKMVDKYDIQDSVCPQMYTRVCEEISMYYDVALAFKYPQGLIKHLERGITNNTMEVFKTTSFKTLSRDALENLLQIDSMDCSERYIFTAAIQWATQSCANKGLPASIENLKAELGECLEKIRFPVMTARDFLNYMEKYPGLLDHRIMFDIMQYTIFKRPLTHAKYFNVNRRQESPKQLEAKRLEALFRSVSPCKSLDDGV